MYYEKVYKEIHKDKPDSPTVTICSCIRKWLLLCILRAGEVCCKTSAR